MLKGTVVVSKGLGARFLPASLLIKFPLFPTEGQQQLCVAENGEVGDKILSINFKLYKYLIFKPHEPLECQAKQTYSPRGCTQ